MSHCKSCGARVLRVKLRCSGRLVLADPELLEWVAPNTRNPGVRVVTDNGAVIRARRMIAELRHRVAVDGWAVHRCDPLFVGGCDAV